MLPAWKSIKLFLVSPTTFFEKRPPAGTLPIAAALVALLGVVLTVAILLVGSIFAEAVDATVMVDNPDRPPDTLCDQFVDVPESGLGVDCDEPETIERDVGVMVRDTAQEFAWIGFLVPFLMWMLGTIVIFAAGRLAGGTPSLQGAISIAGWAALPELVRTFVGMIGLRYVLSDLRIDDPDQALSVVEDAIAPIEPLFIIASLITMLWQWSILSGGLANDADLPWGRAAIAVGVPLILVYLISLG